MMIKMEYWSFKCSIWFLILSAVILIVSGCGTIEDKTANDVFYKNHDAFTLTIYPVNIIKGSMTVQDKYLSNLIAEYLVEEFLANPTVGDRKYFYSAMFWQNEASIVRNSAKGFAAQVQTDHISTRYALLVELNSNSTEKKIFSVNYTLVTTDGKIVEAKTLDPSDFLYKEMNPLNRTDGAKLVMKALKENWKNRL